MDGEVFYYSRFIKKLNIYGIIVSDERSKFAALSVTGQPRLLIAKVLTLLCIHGIFGT